MRRQALMTFRATLILFLIAAFLPSCNNAKRDDRKFEEQANKDIQLLDTATLRFIQNWDYVQRGKASFWSKISGNNAPYNCSFYPSVDTSKLSVYQVDNFLRDYKSDLKVDTIYHKIEFTKIADTAVRLFGTDNHGQDFLLATNLSLIKIFPKQNPFGTLSKLTELKDKLNVIGISHYNNLGGFIEFYFPGGQHILTYLPDTLLNSNELNKFWKTEFLKGKRLKPNWNFRKLDGTIDGG
jgi:hypothetical protein